MDNGKENPRPQVSQKTADKPHIRLNRRKLFGFGIAAATVIPAVVLNRGFLKNKSEELAGEGLSATAVTAREMIENPALLNLFLGATAEVMNVFALHDKREVGSPRVTENGSYRPMVAIINRATEGYIKKGGVVIYRRLPFWRDNSYYADKLTKAMEQDAKDLDDIRLTAPYSLEDSVAILFGIDRHINKVYVPALDELGWTSSFGFNQNPPHWEEIADDNNPDRKISLPKNVEASGLYNEVAKQMGKMGWDELSSSVLDYKDNPLVATVVKGYFDEIEKFTEMMVQRNNGQPISASVILEFLLDKNRGLLNRSLVDLALFLEYEARGKKPLDVTVEQWMVSNILDEYSKVINYSTLSAKQYPYKGLLPVSMMTPDRDQDLSRINRVGGPYQVWSLVSKLVGFPSMMVKLGVSGEDTSYFADHGPAKIAANLQVAAETDDIDKLLTRFQE